MGSARLRRLVGRRARLGPACRIHRPERPPEYPERELGWVILEGFEGKGYAFEAAKLARAYAFETLKFETLVSYIDPDNARSIRLAEKLGAVRDDKAARPEGDGCLVYRHANRL
jgi:RimJ/RimL family protein N-acetyltransferase